MKCKFKKLLGMMLALYMAVIVWPGSVAEVRAEEKIPISSAEDFLNMENNPSGSYYLTKDITLPKEMKTLFPYDALGKSPRFTGTLDGKGHKLKGFTYHGEGSGNYWEPLSLFGAARNATFKNLSLTGVDINISAGEGDAAVSAFVYDASGCKFDKVSISGNITINGKGSKKGAYYEVNGLTGRDISSSTSFTNCKSSLKIKINGGDTSTLLVSGMVGDGKTLKNCSFSGSISASAKITYQSGKDHKGFVIAGLCKDARGKLTGCVNSGDITLKLDKGTKDEPNVGDEIGVYGIAGGNPQPMTSCGNSGNIKVSAPKIKAAVRAYGLAGQVKGDPEKRTSGSLKKCWNKGNISVTGGSSVGAAGLCETVALAEQCYNKGTVSGNGTETSVWSDVTGGVVERQGSLVGGLCVGVNKMYNCYNVGKVSLKGRGWVGGLASALDMVGNTTCNYSIGTVSALSKSCFAAALFPYYYGVESYMKNKCMVYNNYYNGCKLPYSQPNPDSSVKTNGKATKVSSVTSKSCPKLSSKYWTYSSKYKRLILKNNKEK